MADPASQADGRGTNAQATRHSKELQYCVDMAEHTAKTAKIISMVKTAEYNKMYKINSKDRMCRVIINDHSKQQSKDGMCSVNSRVTRINSK